jgi:hypothetical protein
VLHGEKFTGKFILLRFKKAGEMEWIVIMGRG